jgi:hypothetical protein
MVLGLLQAAKRDVTFTHVFAMKTVSRGTTTALHPTEKKTGLVIHVM